MRASKKHIRIRSLSANATATVVILNQNSPIQSYSPSTGICDPFYSRSNPLTFGVDFSFVDRNKEPYNVVSGAEHCTAVQWFYLVDGVETAITDSDQFALVEDGYTKLNVIKDLRPDSSLNIFAVCEFANPSTGMAEYIRTSAVTVGCISEDVDEYVLNADSATAFQLNPLQTEDWNVEFAAQLILGSSVVDEDEYTCEWKYRTTDNGAWQDATGIAFTYEQAGGRRVKVDMASSLVRSAGGHIEMMCVAYISTGSQAAVSTERMKVVFYAEVSLPTLKYVRLIPMSCQEILVSNINASTPIAYGMEVAADSMVLTDEEVMRYYNVLWTITVPGKPDVEFVDVTSIATTFGEVGAYDPATGSYVMPQVEVEVEQKTSY